MNSNVLTTAGLSESNKTLHTIEALEIKSDLDALSDGFDVTLMHNRIGNGTDFITNFLRLKKVISNEIDQSSYYEFENTVSDAKIVCLIA